jgi:carbonic anhydrase/acetyltransferase-like protein (isoleucine patch superfamily)
MQKWTQGVGAMNHGAEVSRLAAIDHGAEILDAANIDSDVALKKKSSAPQITAPR